MANHKSAQKRARQTIVKNERNNVRKSKVKTLVKKLRVALEAKDLATAKTLLPETQSQLNKLVTAGIMKKNTAARRTSRIAAQVAKASK